MAYLFAPRPSIDDLPVFFNVDGVVGEAPSENKREDVLLIQFVFDTIGRQPKPTTSPEVLAAAKAVKPTGAIDKATIEAIRVFQKGTTRDGAAVDGRVSPAKSGYSYGCTTFTIANLNMALHDRAVDVWPRIDKMPTCPQELREMVVRTVAGK